MYISHHTINQNSLCYRYELELEQDRLAALKLQDKEQERQKK